MNILSFDIEEWYIEKEFHGGRNSKYEEFYHVLNTILEILENRRIKATFFCLGKIATDFPEVVKLIANHGHEIGSHSHRHRWVNKMNENEFRNDTHDSISALEDVSGKKVKSFRAPAFSINENNIWAFDILKENGIENDASIFPGVRDLGGFPNFKEQKPCKIICNDVELNEFPIQLYSIPIINKEIAYSGGGYFRMLPYEFVKRQISHSGYTMCYFHIGDLLAENKKFMTKAEYENYFNEDGTLYKRLIRHFKSNIGRGYALINLKKLIETFKFVSIEEYVNINKIEKSVRLLFKEV